MVAVATTNRRELEHLRITDGWRIGGNLEQNQKQLQTVGTGDRDPMRPHVPHDHPRRLHGGHHNHGHRLADHSAGRRVRDSLRAHPVRRHWIAGSG